MKPRKISQFRNETLWEYKGHTVKATREVETQYRCGMSKSRGYTVLRIDGKHYSGSGIRDAVKIIDSGKLKTV